MFASNKMSLYSYGILTEKYLKCSSIENNTDHSVLLVGYGKVKIGDIGFGMCKEYWIIKSSWGTNWGENGLFRLCMDNAGAKGLENGTCQINRFAYWPKLDNATE